MNMKVSFDMHFSKHPELVVVFTNALGSEQAQFIVTGQTKKIKSQHKTNEKSLREEIAHYRHFMVYANDTFFYNEIIGFVKNGFFAAREHETFSLYEQGKFREILYAPLALVPVDEKAVGSTGDVNGRGTSSNGENSFHAGKFLDSVRHLGAKLVSAVSRGRSWEVDLSGLANMLNPFKLHETDFITAFVEGFHLGTYRFTYQDKTKSLPVHSLRLVGAALQREELATAIKRGVYTAEAIAFARDLTNAAPNDLTVPRFVKMAREVAKLQHVRIQELGHAKLLKDGFGGLVAVNSASREKAKLLILSYAPPKATKTIVLVGKGVLFDSGGLSLKPSASMAEMKMDMSGAALVLALMSVLPKLALKLRVLAALPMTDNLVGPDGLRVGDVLTLHNGKRVEVLNTDAEGRLILADALSYMTKRYRADYVIDFATLTGACVVALGHHYAGLWSNTQELAEALLHAGEETQELLWQMPLHREYLTELQSPIADLKNIGGPYGGANTAAKFLEQFVGTAKWAHLDIAGTMSYQHEQGYKKKGASGFGVRLMLQFLANQA